MIAETDTKTQEEDPPHLGPDLAQTHTGDAAAAHPNLPAAPGQNLAGLNPLIKKESLKKKRIATIKTMKKRESLGLNQEATAPTKKSNKMSDFCDILNKNKRFYF